MITTRPLAIFLLVCGTYCPSAQADLQAFTFNYSLERCISNEQYIPFDPRSSHFEFVCSKEDPLYCSLTESSPSQTKTHIFKRATVEFTSMIDKELTLIMLPENIEWSVTCEFTSVTQAQNFYKLIMRGRQSELELHVKGLYLKNSNDALLARLPRLFVKGEHNVTIVVTNTEGDPVLIFLANAVSRKIHREDDPTKIDLYITSVDRSQEVLYKFSFSTPIQAKSFNVLL